jgi:hypothetical protein
MHNKRFICLLLILVFPFVTIPVSFADGNGGNFHVRPPQFSSSPKIDGTYDSKNLYSAVKTYDSDPNAIRPSLEYRRIYDFNNTFAEKRGGAGSYSSSFPTCGEYSLVHQSLPTSQAVTRHSFLQWNIWSTIFFYASHHKRLVFRYLDKTAKETKEIHSLKC